MNKQIDLKNRDGLCLALGGGAARGFAHLGIIKVLEEHNIPIAGICGTSMGAWIGACYALHPNADAIIRDFKAYVNSSSFVKARFSFMRKARTDTQVQKATLRERLNQGMLLGRSYSTGSIISFEDFRFEISSLLPNKTFKNTVIPFFAVAVDLTNTREVVFNSGFLRSAVLASSAIPGAFPVTRQGNTVYVDGGWMNNIPVNPLLVFGARHVLAIDVTDNQPPDINPRRGYAIYSQANKALSIRLSEVQCERASLIWHPPVKGIHWSDFTEIDKAVEAGVNHARSHIHEIKDILNKRPPKLTRWQNFLLRLAKIPQEPKRPIPKSFDVRTIWDVGPAEMD